MVSVWSLWLPIVLSAVFVFVASFIIHTLLRYHKNDIRKLDREAEVMAALRPFNIPPGDYGFPKAESMETMKKPEYLEKMKAGPVAFMTVVPNGPPDMNSSLLLWFLYSVLISIFAAYVTAKAFPAHGGSYRGVFRFAGCASFAGYSLALLQNSIWYKRNWGATLRGMFDGLIYGLLTAGTFGWLWPQ
ncbi:MAG TPA: hypothetical protein VHR45_06455 [Thermoanaerobaculia bacterium]|nr:hypothetical protein [Thermoanaerobaculia bacterium]